ncbi:MAG: 1-aminocyclopropane-1-carboxylate deaminase/D-cysteine desulfhydrase [Acinetobacter sp.]|uniref:1-aminocyclopropane-1-carboxylate deaminase/D-cysteine desulfhydrase n=1 Tax=Acinetobacter sp. TaxID=472 RepID=UPI003CFF79CA
MFDSITHSIPVHTIYYRDVAICIKRLDLVHPQISGNKFFKLKYNFLAAKNHGFNKVITFGGAYSNHIAATAFAAHQFGFESVGIIRGEELQYRVLNPTLATAQHFGMQLKFISRERYREKSSPVFLQQLAQDYPDHYIIPEGGTNQLAIQGCTEILSDFDRQHFDIICCAVGTGGTITGLIESSAEHQQLLGFSALKGDFLHHDVASLTSKRNWKITDAYCCGGYAKTTTELLSFIQHFEHRYDIPLEHIYTGKMLYGIFNLIEQGLIQPQQRLLIIHSGGLQGKLKAD